MIIPNWCSSSYVLANNTDEVKELYVIMKKLERRKKHPLKTVSE